MKTIGLIGGMSWESTAHYYALINQYIQEKLGGLHSAKILLTSVDFAEIEAHQKKNEWDEITVLLLPEAQKLEEAGADFIIICTNTIHKIVPVLAPSLHIPLLHIAEATAEALQDAGIRKAGLLGTKYTLQDNFYGDKLAEYGIETIIPQPEDVDCLNRIIFDELCMAKFCDASKTEVLDIISRLEERGAEAVILACTELDLLIKAGDAGIPIFDTTKIHAEKAAKKAIEK